MKQPLWQQIVILAVLAAVLGAANNLRPKASIPWVRDWPAFSELAAEALEQAPVSTEASVTVEEAPSEDVDTAALAAETAEFVVSNSGITDIDLKRASEMFQYTRELTFWIDARSPELYEKGHIEGAQLLYLYELNTYLPQVDAEIQAAQPVALVVYCKGRECTDSHHLSQELAGLGYGNIFVYRDGFNDWYEAGHPVGGAAATAQPPSQADGEAAAPRTLPEEKSGGMYLEHIVRDMVPFLLGLGLLFCWRRAGQSRKWVLTASVVAGAFFIYAAYPKILNPFLFAKNIWNYDIAPAAVINLSALYLPTLELIAGVGLIFGILRKGSSAVISVLLVIFIAAVSFNVLRGHEFNCGCTSSATLITDLYLQGWNDKLTLILRDIGLLVMALLGFRDPPK